ncbi:MAG: DoxX family protein [Bacteroidetes bacterium]|nr:DoxX family protein [Bacteroidota bacterium]
MKTNTQAINAREISSQKVGAKIWIGRILSGIAVLFLLFDSITKILQAPYVMQASAKFGYPTQYIPAIGATLLVLIILYIIPRTSIFAAILLTGYLGGAVEANLRTFSPFFSNTLFPVYFAVIVWGGLYLRDDLIKQFIPFRRKDI